MTSAALSRRSVLKLFAAGGVASTLPWWTSGCSDAPSLAAQPVRFFTPGERATIELMAGTVVPEDQTVGALGAGAVEYIDRYLASFDAPVPPIFRAGPFSGRWPFPDASSGDPSDDYPRHGFLNLLPLTRLQEATFRIELLGSASVPGAEANAPLVPPWPGLQTLYRDAVVVLDHAASKLGAASFADLDDAERLAAFADTTPEFRGAFIAHIAEGMFSAPEYGGNTDLSGWRDYAYDGDSQPLGYTLYDRTTQTLRDRPDRPNQTADPARPARPFEPAVESFVETITLAQGGKRFY